MYAIIYTALSHPPLEPAAPPPPPIFLVQIRRYMGPQTAFANCTCSEEIISQAINDSIPKFAV